MTVSRTICLGFLAVIAVGTLLFATPLTIGDATSSGMAQDWLTSWRIALYTGTSAVCVTGLSLVDVGKYFNFFGQVILILLVQIGGLGYMTATTLILLLLRKRLNLRDKVAIQQSLDATGLSGLSNVVRSIIATTLIFEVTGAIFFFSYFLDPSNLPDDVEKLPYFVANGDYTPLKALWLAIFHSISAFNNAGFSLFSDNLGSFTTSVPISLVVAMLFVCGGIGYQAIMEMFAWGRHMVSRQPGKFLFSLNFKVAMLTMLGLLGAGTVGFFLIESQNSGTLQSLNAGQQLIAAFFQSATTRTAGFNTIDIGQMTTTGLFLTLMMMFIGANPGGTGGGIKTTTFYVLLKTTYAVLKGEDRVLSHKRRIPPALIFKANAVVVGSGLVVLIATILLTLTDAQLARTNFVGVFFEVVSAFATVGLSQIGSSTFSPAGQFVIIVTMYIGRVGVLMLMGALLGDPKQSFVKYPEENMLVG